MLPAVFGSRCHVLIVALHIEEAPTERPLILFIRALYPSIIKRSGQKTC